MIVTWSSYQLTSGEDALLGWAKSQAVKIGTTEMTAQSVSSGWTDLSRSNVQLQAALVSLCSDERLTVIRTPLNCLGLDVCGADSAKSTSRPTISGIFDFGISSHGNRELRA